MNKKVDDKFIGIKDVYVLQCICTEQSDEIERLNNIINNIDKKCKHLLENEKVIINEKTYYKQKCDDIITNFIYEELKGSDEE